MTWSASMRDWYTVGRDISGLQDRVGRIETKIIGWEMAAKNYARRLAIIAAVCSLTAVASNIPDKRVSQFALDLRAALVRR